MFHLVSSFFAIFFLKYITDQNAARNLHLERPSILL